MLHGFGLYPVSLQIDIDSYDGDWRHVARFRNRSGWLAVAEAEIWSDNDLCATLPLIVGCDENEEEIPAFIAANLLGCATSYPEPCYEFAPPVLDDLLDEQRGEVRKRWLRENVAAIAAIHEQAEQALLELENKVAAQTRKSDKAIAHMRRQRRFLPPDDPRRALLADAIANEEEWQDRMIDWLVERRDELRCHYDALERKASKGQRPRVAVEILYLINWRHQSAPSAETIDVFEKIVQDIRQTETKSSSSLHLDAEQLEALKELARDPDWVPPKDPKKSKTDKGAPKPRKAPPRRIEVDWEAIGAIPAKRKEPSTEEPANEVGATPASTRSPSSSTATLPAARPPTHPKTRLERTEAKRSDVLERLKAIRLERASHTPGSKRFRDCQRKERRLTNHIAALDAEISSLRSRMEPPKPVAAPTPKPAPPPRPPAATPPRVVAPASASMLLRERVALQEQLKALDIQGQKFLPGSPKTQRNQLEQAEVRRKLAALDRRIEALSVSPAPTPTPQPAPESSGRTKQDLMNEMLRRADT